MASFYANWRQLTRTIFTEGNGGSVVHFGNRHHDAIAPLFARIQRGQKEVGPATFALIRIQPWLRNPHFPLILCGSLRPFTAKKIAVVTNYEFPHGHGNMADVYHVLRGLPRLPWQLIFDIVVLDRMNGILRIIHSLQFVHSVESVPKSEKTASAS
jgi:hypothetical protein